MVKVNMGQVRVSVRGTWLRAGSVIAGTIESRCTAIESKLEVQSDDDPALIAALIQNARGGCYAEAALAEAVPVTLSATLNEKQFEYEDYPKKPPRRGDHSIVAHGRPPKE